MKPFICLLFSLLISAAAWSAPVLKSDHPERYVVVKGDTLWDISGRFLENPWEWRAIWGVNQQIENPHLIYPGDVLTLSFIDGKPVISVNQEPVSRGKDFYSAPSDRDRLPGTSIPMVPLSDIEKFLDTNRIVLKSTRESAPYIVGMRSGSIIAGKGDIIFARGDFSGDRAYSIYRPDNILRDPETSVPLAEEARHIADVVVLSYKNDIAELKVDRSNQEIYKGDFLMPRRNAVDMSQYYPKKPERLIQGQVIAMKDDATRATRWNIVTLNRGYGDGLHPGTVLAVYKKPEQIFDERTGETIELPSERLGELVVFRLFEKISYAVVARVNDTIKIGDHVVNPSTLSGVY